MCSASKVGELVLVVVGHALLRRVGTSEYRHKSAGSNEGVLSVLGTAENAERRGSCCLPFLAQRGAADEWIVPEPSQQGPYGASLQRGTADKKSIATTQKHVC